MQKSIIRKNTQHAQFSDPHFIHSLHHFYNGLFLTFHWSLSNIQLFFLRKVVRLNNAVVPSRFMQLKKERRGFQREAY